MNGLQVGMIAVFNRKSVLDGRVLHCGSGVYSHAIVGSVDPFVLVSQCGDMVWHATVKPEYFDFLCLASEEIQKTVRNRLEKTKEHLIKKAGVGE